MRKSILKKTSRVAVAGLAAGSLLATLLPAPAQAATAPVVVSSKLNNPRQLSLTSDGVLLVAEAGKGGKDCTGEGEAELCIGTTGSVSALFTPDKSQKAQPTRVVTGLVSGAGSSGGFAIGPDGVSARKFLGGTIFSQETYAPPESFPKGLPSSQSGKLLYAWPGYSPKVASDVSKYELTQDPDKMGPESNPYAVLDLGDRRLVADAAGNSIVSVDKNGKISLFHVFPNIKSKDCVTANPATGWPGYDPTAKFPGCHWVPTSLAEGPNGDIYVGGLASHMPGNAQVVQLDRKTGAWKKTWSGFTDVTGVGLDKDGNLYVSELFAPQKNTPTTGVVGLVTKVGKDGKRASQEVPYPAGIAVDKSKNVFVAAYSVSPESGMPGAPEGVDTSGQVWRLKF